MAKQKNIEGEIAWEDVEDPDFFKFENIGDKISGELVEIGKSERYSFGLYTVKTPDDNLVRFHGSAQLDSRMKQVNVGDYVMVEFIDIEEQDKGDMKLYDVKRAVKKD